MNFNNSRLVDHKPMKFGTFVPYMYRFVIIVKYLTNFFKLIWNLGIKFTLRFFFLSVYVSFVMVILYCAKGDHKTCKIRQTQIYSRLSLSRSPRDRLKFFEISVPRHIRFAEMRKKYILQPHFTNEYVIWLLKLEIYWKYCGKEEKLLLNFSSFPQYFVTCC